MTHSHLDDLPERLVAQLRHRGDRPSRHGLSPAMSYGRHNGPARSDARKAAVLLLLYQRDGEWHLPLTRRQEYLSQHGGQISLPGGAVDPGERSDQAALREADEELGIRPDDVELLGSLDSVYLFNSNFDVTPWVAATRRTIHFRPNVAEVAELIELPLSVLLASEEMARTTIHRGMLEFSAPCIDWRGTRIWGATHLMLGELRRIVQSPSEDPGDR